MSASLSFTEAQLAAIGITRIADLTGLSALQVPVYSVTRPDAYTPGGQSITVFKGKGFTRAMARTGAIMEAAERHAADPRTSPLERRTASRAELLAEGAAALTPNELVRPRGWPLCDDAQPLEWVRGREVATDAPVWVPLANVLMPYEPPGEVAYQGFWGSHGLASSHSVVSATVSGMLELVERFSVARAHNADRARRVALAEPLPERLRWLTGRFRGAGVNVVVKDVTCPELGIPVFFAAVDDPVTRNNYLVTRGQSAHWDPETAVVRALLEAAQCRTGLIQGAREDVGINPALAAWDYDALIGEAFRFFFSQEGEAAPLSAYERVELPGVEAARDRLLGALGEAGYARVVAVELTRPEVGIPVVRVVIPGLVDRIGGL
jgi:ribosomal protein S12 methylthiotransferase accessory factor